MQIQGAPGGGTDFEVDLICIFNLRDLKIGNYERKVSK